jgi:hypothetical protein
MPPPSFVEASTPRTLIKIIHWTHLHFPSIVLDPRCPRALSSTRQHPTVLEEEGQKVEILLKSLLKKARVCA